MPGVSPRMIEWWFGDYMQTTDHYKRWHPRDHVWMSWEDKRPGTAEVRIPRPDDAQGLLTQPMRSLDLAPAHDDEPGVHRGRVNPTFPYCFYSPVARY